MVTPGGIPVSPNNRRESSEMPCPLQNVTLQTMKRSYTQRDRERVDRHHEQREPHMSAESNLTTSARTARISRDSCSAKD
jgi:hypothetical protein